jgi:hypothetical protein
MEATRPIDGNIRRASAQLASSSKGRSGIHTTKIEHVSENGAILDTVDVVDQMSHVVLVTRSDPGSTVPCEGYRELRIALKGQDIP